MIAVRVKVRKARSRDAPDILKIHRELYGNLSDEEAISFIQSYNYPFVQYFVAEGKDKSVLAFIGWAVEEIEEDKMILELSFLAVKKEYQEKGVGKKLLYESLAAVRKFWRDKGLEAVMIIFSVKGSNRAAQAFWETVLAPEIKDTIPNVWGKGESEIFYYKKLAKGDA